MITTSRSSLISRTLHFASRLYLYQMRVCLKTILSNSIVEEKGDVEHGRNTPQRIRLTYHLTNPPRMGGPMCPPAHFDSVLPFIDVNAALAGWMHRVCADLAGCYENSGLCLVRLGWFHALSGPVGRPSPMVMTIMDGARPGNRRMIAGLQPTAAEMSGSRHPRSTFHPASRWSA